MPSKLVLDKQDGDFAEVLADCKPGDQKILEVTVVVTHDDDRLFEADVKEVSYDESEAGAEAETPPQPEEAAAAGNLPPPKKRPDQPPYRGP